MRKLVLILIFIIGPFAFAGSDGCESRIERHPFTFFVKRALEKHILTDAEAARSGKRRMG